MKNTCNNVQKLTYTIVCVVLNVVNMYAQAYRIHALPLFGDNLNSLYWFSFPTIVLLISFTIFLFLFSLVTTIITWEIS